MVTGAGDGGKLGTYGDVGQRCDTDSVGAERAAPVTLCVGNIHVQILILEAGRSETTPEKKIQELLILINFIVFQKLLNIIEQKLGSFVLTIGKLEPLIKMDSFGQTARPILANTVVLDTYHN